ncbi:MAG: DinB family protein [Balneolaceae bacterium]|nr:DinB family protein [Balneolaceae bacterium]
MSKRYTYSGLTGLFEESIKKAEELAKLSPEKLSYKPSDKVWCTGEIVQHLVRFNELYLRFIDKAISKSDNPTTDQPDFYPGFLIRMFISFLNPPYKMKIKTLNRMEPLLTEAKDYQTDIEELIRQNKEIISRINEAETSHLDLKKIKGKNSVFKIRMSLTEFILIWHSHQKRHFWQAEKTLELAG